MGMRVQGGSVMTRSVVKILRWAPALLVLGVAACSQQQGQSVAAADQPIEKTFTLASSATMRVDFLSGQLQGLTITERIQPKSKSVVDPPELRGTLKLKNDSKDQSAQLIGGHLVFLDAKGQEIPVAKDRGSASIAFSAYETPRLNPGQETSQTIDVPFPRAGLQASEIRSIRLDLSYLPSPYREQGVNYPVSLKG
jgi:hypothetical protein